jgi:hypothetical protein
MLPLIAQLFFVDTFIVIALNSFCLITNIYLFIFELIDIINHKKGESSYFDNKWNYIDLSRFVFYLIYYVVRLFTANK